jgi:hypothetical protein
VDIIFLAFRQSFAILVTSDIDQEIAERTWLSFQSAGQGTHHIRETGARIERKRVQEACLKTLSFQAAGASIFGTT